MAIDLANSLATPLAAGFDETLADAGAYAQIIRALAGADLNEVRSDIQREMSATGVRFGSGEAGEFVVDPIPRIISASEWTGLTAGLTQRVRALESFVGDVYGDQRILAEGVVPRTLIEDAPFYERQLRGLRFPTWMPFAGLDVVRDVDGAFLVLEDNLRTPSGLAYALAARQAVGDRVPVPEGRSLLPLGGAAALFLQAIEAAAPEGVSDPNAVVLTDGPANSAHYEHETLALLMGIPLVRLEQLELRSGRVWARINGRRMPVDVLYRRTDVDRPVDQDGRPTAVGEALLEPWRRGRLGLVNGFGTGVADDKLVHAYVEEMVRFYLGEEPLLGSVPSHDISRPDVLEMVLERLPELVVKPRDGHGGQGVVIGPCADPHDLSRARTELREDPGAFIAQELVSLSSHPTARDDGLRQRRIDLRAFVVTIGERVEVIPGGLTRVALEGGSFVVNSSQGGGAKDTWILA